MEGTEQVLLALRSSNIATHVVTSARTDFAELLLDHGGIRELVDEVHASSHNKARTFTSILERTGCEPTECVMLGDLPSDVQYAKQAGIVGIGLMNSHVPREVFQTVTDMDYFALHLKGFLGYVETLHVYSQRG
jgi:phosphoglycolate phosphatase-like HAD superfamily hydrolase